MTWDAQSVVVVIGALGTMLISVIGAVFAGVMAWQAKINSVENGRKSDTLIEKATEIHTLTNSNLSKVTASLEVALQKIEGLQRLVHEMSDAKDAAARAGVNSRTDIASAMATPPPPPREHNGRATDHSDKVQQVEVVNQPLAVITDPPDEGR